MSLLRPSTVDKLRQQLPANLKSESEKVIAALPRCKTNLFAEKRKRMSIYSPGERRSEVYGSIADAVRSEDFYDRSLLAYLSNLGDVAKAAQVSGIPEERLQAQVVANKWDERLRQLLEVREKKGQAEYARQVNRLLNLTQAARLRALVDVVLQRATKDEQSMQHFLSAPTKFGPVFSARAFADLAKAAQLAQAMTYAALGDGTTERLFNKKHGTAEEEESPQLSVLKALTQLAHNAAPGNNSKPSAPSIAEPEPMPAPPPLVLPAPAPIPPQPATPSEV